jgi:hypothetical protein
MRKPALAVLAMCFGCHSTHDAPWQLGASVGLSQVAASSNSELDALYEQDQADREGVFGDGGTLPSSLTKRDEERLQRVEAILDAGAARVSADFEHAAMLFQHGHDVEAYRRAHALALQAVQLDPSNKHAKWLAAASKDRELVTLGKPQLYGTQFRSVERGPWFLYPVDPSITDEERARWNVPPLAESERRAAEMNAELALDASH